MRGSLSTSLTTDPSPASVGHRAPPLAEVAAAVVACAVASVVGSGAWRRGFPVDDAWIHMVYGLELARDHQLAYNDGISATGATSPLWAAVAAIAHVVTRSSGPSMRAAMALKVFGIASHALTSALAARAGRVSAPTEVARYAALAAGLVTAACPILAYAGVSGMEVELTAALIIAALTSALHGSAGRTGVLLGLAFLSRPEAATAGPVCVLALVLGGPSLREGMRRSVVATISACSFAGALFLRNLAVSGRPLPATYYAKAAPAWGRVVGQIRDVLGPVVPAPALFFTLAGVPIAVALTSLLSRTALRAPAAEGPSEKAARAGASFALAGIAYAAATSGIVRVLGPGSFYFQRYFLPALPLFSIAAVSGASIAGIWAGAIWSRRGPTRDREDPSSSAAQQSWVARSIVALPALGALAIELVGVPATVDRYRRSTEDIDAVQVAMGQFIARTVPRDGVVWSMDAGGPRYFGERFVVDLGKLNTPELFSGAEIPRDRDAHTIVTLDYHGYGAVAEGGTLEPVYSARAPSTPAEVNPSHATQVAWRCHAAGSAPVRVEIVGYPQRRAGYCMDQTARLPEVR